MKKITLSIPQPCHEHWDQMTPADKGRFCASCQKTVVDFTNMSDRQLAEFFKKPAASVCGRFYQEQLNRDIELPRKRIPWARYFFQFTLPAFLVSMKAAAQKRTVVTGDTTYCTRTLGFVAAVPAREEPVDAGTLAGKVVDPQGRGMPGASVVVKNTKTGVQTDQSGAFRIHAEPGSILAISSVGYQSKEVAISGQSSSNITLVQLEPQLLGGVVVVGFTRTKAKPVPLIKAVIDTAFKKFSVYPNPVKGKSTIHIDLKNLSTGDYLISLQNMAGQTVQSKIVAIERKHQTVELAINETAAGTYLVRVSNRTTGASHSEKIVVQ